VSASSAALAAWPIVVCRACSRVVAVCRYIAYQHEKVVGAADAVKTVLDSDMPVVDVKVCSCVGSAGSGGIGGDDVSSPVGLCSVRHAAAAVPKQQL
jgi:hypothetical protein